MPVECSTTGEGTVIYHPELVNIYGSEIGSHCKIAAFVEIGPAMIGDYCNIQARAFIPAGVIICNRVFVGPGVIFCNDKNPPSGGGWKGYPRTVVQDEASIGAGAIIMPGVVIGKKARIAAGAIITKDVPDGELSFGAKGKG
jgi:UDP-2-acetamido-3-amino-2,3-dideoxy-glucuronate N-acetyltransferase